MGRQLRTCLDQVIPDLAKHVQDAQLAQKQYHDEHTKHCNFSLGQRVLVRNNTGSPYWLPGIIKTVLGTVSYQVELNDGKLWKRHLDQLLKDRSQVNDSQIDKDIIDFPVTEPSPTQPTGTAANPPVRQSSRP